MTRAPYTIGVFMSLFACACVLICMAMISGPYVIGLFMTLFACACLVIWMVGRLRRR